MYKKAGWKESDFVHKSHSGGGGAGGGGGSGRPNSPTNMNSTLNRPMASQSGTRYEDRTMVRRQAGSDATDSAAAGGGPRQQQMNNAQYGVRVSDDHLESKIFFFKGPNFNQLEEKECSYG